MDVTLESVSDMSSEAQIQLFDRLAELGVTGKAFAVDADVCERTVRRWACGAYPIPAEALRRVIRAATDGRVKTAIADYSLPDAGLLVYEADAGEGMKPDPGIADMLEQVARFERERADHLADGDIDAEELDAELSRWREVLRAGHKRYQALAAQKVSERKQARQLAMVK